VFGKAASVAIRAADFVKNALRLIDPSALLMPSSVWIVARLSWNASPFPTANEGKQFSIDDLDRITFGATHHSETPRFVLRARGEKRRSEDSYS
jgi:hypothetical protein